MAGIGRLPLVFDVSPHIIKGDSGKNNLFKGPPVLEEVMLTQPLYIENYLNKPLEFQRLV